MNSFRRFRFLVSLLGVLACERARPPATVDTLAAKRQAAAESASAASPARNWDRNAGPVLLVAAESPTRAFVLVPDSATAASALASLPHPAAVTLFGRSGTVQTAELPAVPDADACVVATLNAAPPPRPWSVGFLGGVESPLGMDSLQSIGRADSTDLVASAIRLASALPNDTAGRFAGLPFVVRAVWRFTIPGGPLVVAAVLIRQINQEATPLQEHTLIVGERAVGDSVLATSYSERSYGDEETIESREVLAAALFGAAHNAAIIVAHDFGNATSYGLVERGDDGKWRARWFSAKRKC